MNVPAAVAPRRRGCDPLTGTARDVVRASQVPCLGACSRPKTLQLNGQRLIIEAPND